VVEAISHPGKGVAQKQGLLAQTGKQSGVWCLAGKGAFGIRHRPEKTETTDTVSQKLFQVGNHMWREGVWHEDRQMFLDDGAFSFAVDLFLRR
jgi:hypothetical protein